jgi:predicted CXXCH cytochrome family protein
MARLVVAVATATLTSAGPAPAFHEEGTANCNGCHLSHPDEVGDGALVGPSADGGLLIAESPSDVCLLCHAESLGAVLAPDPLAPPPERGPGNFAFLLEDNLNDAEDGATDPVPGDAAGHNLAAPGHALTPDPRYPRAPGGTFPSDQLGCTSCHDPHGNTSYQMLHGAGPVMGGVATFARPAPEAVGMDLDSRRERRRRHNAYWRGMSEWCGNCHGRYHEAGSGLAFEHPVDASLGVSVSRRYNEYRGDREPTGEVSSTAYLPEVPFEDPGNNPSSTRGTSPRSRIMCLSCHRAHGSSSPAAGRWDFNVSFLADDGRESGSYRIPDPYGDPAQGPLCRKCHEASGSEGIPPPGTGRLPPPPSWPTGSEPPSPD